MIASGYDIGEKKRGFLKDRNLLEFVEPAKKYLDLYGDKIDYPIDLAYPENDKRHEMTIDQLPAEKMFMDIGSETLKNMMQYYSKLRPYLLMGQLVCTKM